MRRLDGRGLFLLCGVALGHEGFVLGLLLLLALEPAKLKRVEVAAALEADGGDEALDFGASEGVE